MLMRNINGFKDYLISEDGQVWSIKGKIFLTQITDNRGYVYVDLYNSSGKKKTPIHRILLISFVGINTLMPFACHRNDIKSDNTLTNLYWGNHSTNTVDMHRNGRTLNKKMKRKINNLQVRIIRNYPYHYGCNIFLAEIFNSKSDYIKSIRLGRKRKQLEGLY